MSEATIQAGGGAGEAGAAPAVEGVPPDRPNLRTYAVAAAFLAPALVLLGVWIVYPAIYTIVRSFFGQTGFIGHWVGIDAYEKARGPLPNRAWWEVAGYLRFPRDPADWLAAWTEAGLPLSAADVRTSHAAGLAHALSRLS